MQGTHLAQNLCSHGRFQAFRVYDCFQVLPFQTVVAVLLYIVEPFGTWRQPAATNLTTLGH
jgi:hypothetical protein